MKNKNIVINAIIIAIYVSISLLLSSFSFGPIQIRVAEVLLVLCLYNKKYIFPITIGCFITNLIGFINGLNPIVIDIIVGTFATFISGILVYYFKNIKIFNLPIFSLIIPAIINGLLIGFELHYYFSIKLSLLIAYIGISEFISVCLLGLLLYKPISKLIKAYLE